MPSNRMRRALLQEGISENRVRPARTKYAHVLNAQPEQPTAIPSDMQVYVVPIGFPEADEDEPAPLEFIAEIRAAVKSTSIVFAWSGLPSPISGLDDAVTAFYTEFQNVCIEASFIFFIFF